MEVQNLCWYMSVAVKKLLQRKSKDPTPMISACASLFLHIHNLIDNDSLIRYLQDYWAQRSRTTFKYIVLDPDCLML